MDTTYSSAILKYSVATNTWTKIGDTLYPAYEMRVLPVKGLKCV